MLWKCVPSTFSAALDTAFTQHRHYDYVYMSIGSKFNQQDAFFHSVNFPLAKRVDTNALLQMVPMFIRTKPSNQRTLVISVDTYRNGDDILMNQRQIQSVITENIDCIMVDMFCTSETLRELCSTLFTKMIIHDIQENNVMVCNFVKFMNTPNEMEMKSETVIPDTIQSTLQKPEFKKYVNCYAEWYGYIYGLYNCIYTVSPFKNDLYFKKRMTDMETYITQLTSVPLKPQLHRNIKLSKLLMNTYDISSYHDETYTMSIAPSLSYIYNINWPDA